MCVHITIIGVRKALIEIIAGDAVACVTRVTHAVEATRHVDAVGVHVTVVDIRKTFIHVAARGSSSRIAWIAGAGEAPRCIRTGGVIIAVIGIRGAFVDVGAGRPGIARIAGARVRPNGV